MREREREREIDLPDAKVGYLNACDNKIVDRIAIFVLKKDVVGLEVSMENRVVEGVEIVHTARNTQGDPQQEFVGQGRHTLLTILTTTTLVDCPAEGTIVVFPSHSVTVNERVQVVIHPLLHHIEMTQVLIDIICAYDIIM